VVEYGSGLHLRESTGKDDIDARRRAGNPAGVWSAPGCGARR
jgi:hypothetical protein